MSNLTVGDMYSCSDNGNPGNVLSLAPADDNGGWDTFNFFFAGVNGHGQNRIYAANAGGQLLSYAPTNPLSDEVIVGANGWAFGDNFTTVFAGVNLLEQNRIYAVTTDGALFGIGGGKLVSYSDDGSTGNVGNPVVVGADGWGVDNMWWVFAGRDSKGLGCIYAVNNSGNLLLYHDDGNKGNVGNPAVVGKSIWRNDFYRLFAGTNAIGQNRIYGVNMLGQLLSYSASDPVSNEVIVGEPAVINDGTPNDGSPGWAGLDLFTGVNSAGQNVIYGVY